MVNPKVESDRKLMLDMIAMLKMCLSHFKHQHFINRATSELMTLELSDVIHDAERRIK